MVRIIILLYQHRAVATINLNLQHCTSTLSLPQDAVDQTVQSPSAIYQLRLQEIVTGFESVLLTVELLNVGSNVLIIIIITIMECHRFMMKY